MRAAHPAESNLLIFRIDSEQYAIPVEAVQRVLSAVRVTRVPGLPAAISGVVDVHGSLTPLFDLRHRFSLPSREVRAADHFVLAMAGERRVLLHVDEVAEVIRVEAAELMEAIDGGTRPGHISGIARLPRGLVLIHDLETFLSEGEAAQLEDAMADARGDTEGPA